MKKQVRIGGFLVAGALALAVVWWVDWYHWAGGFRTVEPHFAGTCRAIDGIPSPEDLTIDQTTGIAYISSYDRAAARAGNPVPGAILAYDVNAPSPQLVNLTPDADTGFRPHGISLFRTGGDRKLFVINHPEGGHSIEIFRLGEGVLEHERTVTGEALTYPNNLVAVGPEKFYVTNSRHHVTGLKFWLESTFRQNWANVVYFDGEKFSEAVGGIGFPNGINVDHHGETVYVLSSFEQEVKVYDRNKLTGGLTLRHAIAIGTRMDNLEIDGQERLWVASRAQYLDPPQPSQVLRISDAGGPQPVVDEIYVNLGDEFANASVAASYGRHLLIGSSRGTRVLHCLMDREAPDTDIDHDH